MPSTITTYYTFSAGTKARSSQVNTNFSNYRGDLLPVNEATVSASDMTHYLGGSDHRWLGLYAGSINLKGATTTAHTIFQPQTSVTTGAAELMFGSVTATVFDIDSIKLKSMTSTADVKFKSNQNVTTGSLDVLFGSNTITSLSTRGISRQSLDTGLYTTTANQNGQYLIIAGTSVSRTITSAQAWTIAAFSYNNRGSGILEFRLYNTSFTKNGAAALVDPIAVVEFYAGATTTSIGLFERRYISLQDANTVTAGLTVGNVDCNALNLSYAQSTVLGRIVLYLTALAANTWVTSTVDANIIIREY
jgi:hypothetical protein